ncbi:hypothetical protein G647_08363 [Cladophialophora carrionii CBS 160.54]|uniref:FR47-like domain-containing protein n=1 Tax=Cladophialophora carrionii CBS 160.54 TaxID=1279043 RepID=V9D091_9EURO|nr:uncharacterized protein G647_08363 [Cladophialophora carrionii CBS 160.54]ETI20329.1 hypothetical protein G647_08363 [Cladophialophora carrionii CBS 160.54]
MTERQLHNRDQGHHEGQLALEAETGREQVPTQKQTETQTPISRSISSSAPSVSIQSRVLNEHQIALLGRKLELHLPYSIPLLRRIQFHLQQERASTTARIFVAAVRGDDSTITRSNPEPESEPEPELDRPWDLDAWLLETQSSDDTPWIAAHVDLVNAGQTQVWVFGSWEEQAELSRPPTESHPMHNRRLLRHQLLLLRALFTYISRDLIPLLPTTPPEEWLCLARTGKYLSRPYSRDKVLFGSVSDKLWHLFPESARTRTDAGYWKYLFCRDFTSEAPPLPPGYRFGGMQDDDLQTVLDRTPIPRTLGTLRQLVSVGVFHEGNTVRVPVPIPVPVPVPAPGAVGWGFLGKDASLSSLHTEVEHRGRGLAVALGAELLRRHQRQEQQQQQQQQPPPPPPPVVVHSQCGRGDNGSQEERRDEDENAREAMTTSTSTSTSWWGHADVSQHNAASRRVMEKLGGRPAWMVMWTEVDMCVLLALEGWL